MESIRIHRSQRELDGKGAYGARLLQRGSALYYGNDKTNETARYNYYCSGNIPVLNANVNGFFGPGTSFPMVTYAENLLIQAESRHQIT